MSLPGHEPQADQHGKVLFPCTLCTSAAQRTGTYTDVAMAAWYLTAVRVCQGEDWGSCGLDALHGHRMEYVLCPPHLESVLATMHRTGLDPIVLSMDEASSLADAPQGA